MLRLTFYLVSSSHNLSGDENPSGKINFVYLSLVYDNIPVAWVTARSLEHLETALIL